MATKKPTGARNETVRCENCGEYYAVTYKHCPFCDERHAAARRRDEYEDDLDQEYEDEEYGDRDDEFDDEPRARRSGGKRLVTNRRGGGYGGGPPIGKIIGTVLSLLVIAAAIWIIITIIKPFISKGNTGPVPESTPSTPVTASPSVNPSATPGPDGLQPSQDPGTTASPSPSIPAGQTASSFTMSGNGDFTLSDQFPTYQFKVTFTPAGSTGSITWESSKPDVVSVDANGYVRGLAKGTATVTATMAGGYTQSCIVRSSVTGGGSGAVTPAPSANEGGATAASLTLNVTNYSTGYEFSLTSAGDTWRLKVKGTESTPEWSVADASIATVAADGTVTAVAKGKTTITASVDGQTLTCTVRCNW